MPEQLSWGIIGTGGIARDFANDVQQAKVGRVVAVGSRTQETADRFAATHGIATAYRSYEALVSDPSVDAVYVATPHPMHHDNALLALRAGKAVLVEKAFTMTAAEARDLVATARSAGLFLMEAMWPRFLPHVAEIRRLLADGVLGPLVSVSADHGQWFALDPEFRLFAPELGGGALLDLGVYPVSFASMVLGPPDRIVSLITPAFTGVDGQTSILLGHPGGAQAILSCTSSARTRNAATIVGTEGRLEIDAAFYAPGGFTLVPRQGEPVRFDPPHTGRGHWYQAAEVARCLEEGRLESPLMPLDETVSIMETMDAILNGPKI
jgi:predicted dehydrogenase